MKNTLFNFNWLILLFGLIIYSPAESIAVNILQERFDKVYVPEITDSKHGLMPLKLGNCSVLTFKNGDISKVELIQISPSEVRYKRCNKTHDILFVINKNEVFSIASPDGEILFKSLERSDEEFMKNSGKKSRKYANASFTLGLIGVITFISIPGAVMSTLAIIFGGVARKKARNHPQKFKGKKLAFAGLILGVISLSMFASFLLQAALTSF